MKFMMMIKANADTEAGIFPSAEFVETMCAFNEEMAKAGVMLDGGGLQASSKGARVRYSGSKRTVTDGPFTEAKELIAGYWMIQVKSKEEAIDWAKRIPFQEGEVEVRRMFEGAECCEPTPAIEEREEAPRAELAALR